MGQFLKWQKNVPLQSYTRKNDLLDYNFTLSTYNAVFNMDNIKMLQWKVQKLVNHMH